MEKAWRGIYFKGKFFGYPLRAPIKAELNSKSKKIIDYVKKGKIIHGSYMDNKFTPFVKKAEVEYFSDQINNKKEILYCDYQGRLFRDNKFILGILPSGVIVRLEDFRAVIQGRLTF